MKKIISGAFALLLIAALSVSAFAAPITTIGGSEGKEVTGTYVPTSSSMVYSVDISWGAMTFTYTAASTGTWNPATHSYTGASAAAWDWTAESNIITVTNHSNAAVTANLSFTPTASGVVGGFYTATKGTAAVTGNRLSLATAVGTTVNNAPTKSAYFQITGGTISADVKLGDITVTLS